jgi:glyoxylase-like metal-dependent hydrolase (beta-lactamase superfamily II)
MPAPHRRREVGRGERLLPGVWRLRLPLPWPGVPHCNAWAVAAGDGVVLFDCGRHEPGSLGHLERAMTQVGLRLEHVRLLVCTHAHSDHYGQAATIMERSGCELWMHPAHAHATATATDPEASIANRLEIARQSGVPEEPLQDWAQQRRNHGSGLAAVVMPDRDLVDGVTVQTDLGTWTAVETPGHSPSHVSLFQPERRMLISGDHVLGRVSLYYDYGYSPDPVGEFLGSLDRTEDLDARLALPGHGRTFTDVRGHIHAARAAVAQRLDAVLTMLGEHGPLTAFDAVLRVHGDHLTRATAGWWLPEALCYLTHLEGTGRVRRMGGGAEPELWSTVS